MRKPVCPSMAHERRSETPLENGRLFLYLGTMRGPTILRLAGEALYGARWQTPLARDLGTTDRNLRYWHTGARASPMDLEIRLIALLRQRGEKLDEIIAQIEQREAGRPSLPDDRTTE